MDGKARKLNSLKENQYGGFQIATGLSATTDTAQASRVQIMKNRSELCLPK
jgi:hypothetical protein